MQDSIFLRILHFLLVPGKIPNNYIFSLFFHSETNQCSLQFCLDDPIFLIAETAFCQSGFRTFSGIFRSLCICFMIISRTIEERAYRSISESDFSHHLAENYLAHSALFSATVPVSGRSYWCLSGRADCRHHCCLHHLTDVLCLLSKIKMNRDWDYPKI